MSCCRWLVASNLQLDLTSTDASVDVDVKKGRYIGISNIGKNRHWYITSAQQVVVSVVTVCSDLLGSLKIWWVDERVLQNMTWVFISNF